MPELPEVETLVRDLRASHLERARISRVLFRWPRLACGIPAPRLAQTLGGRIILQIGRRAKYIVWTLDSGERLLIHLRMTGKLRFATPGERPGKHDHAVIFFEDGRRLLFNDTRKFGRFRLVPAGDDRLDELGPEPLSPAFTTDELEARLKKKKQRIKPLLLNQRIVAGLGNIYTDEALWISNIHPERPADSLTHAEIRRLRNAIRATLKKAIRLGGTTLGSGKTNFYSVSGHRGLHAEKLNVFRRDGLPCPRCGTLIQRSVVSQRGTHFCPTCQRKPRTPITCKNETTKSKSPKT